MKIESDPLSRCESQHAFAFPHAGECTQGKLATHKDYMPTRHRIGFTLIELIASAVLAAMMMVGLMSIVWSASRDLRQYRTSETTTFPTTLMAERLREDFQNSRGMQWNRDEVLLHGFVARNPSTGDSIWREGRVRYRLANTASGRILVRQQMGRPAEPMWVGVGTLRIESLDQLSPEDALASLPEAGGLPATPTVFRVLLLDPRGRSLLREVIHHGE